MLPQLNFYGIDPFLDEFGFLQSSPSIIWTDTQSGMILAETFKTSHKSQHMAMRLNFIHQEILNGSIFVYATSSIQLIMLLMY